MRESKLANIAEALIYRLESSAGQGKRKQEASKAARAAARLLKFLIDSRPALCVILTHHAASVRDLANIARGSAHNRHPLVPGAAPQATVPGV